MELKLWMEAEPHWWKLSSRAEVEAHFFLMARKKWRLDNLPVDTLARFGQKLNPALLHPWGPKEDWAVVSDGDPAILMWGSVRGEVYVGRTVTQGTSQLFVVELQYVGGEDGSSSAQCTWRYDISKVGNDEILKADDDIGLDPNKYRRINLGKYMQATHGIACFLEGELSVMTSNEVPVAGTC